MILKNNKAATMTGETTMDYDINNQQMLRAGAQFQHRMNYSDGWNPIATAPRDGTVIEVRCTYGVAPWYGLYRWTDGTIKIADQTGAIHELHGAPQWAKVGDDSSGFSEGPSFTWRPYAGNPETYVDPTGGAQNSMAYWRGAAAAKHGLPLDYFEKSVARNIAKNKVRGFWRWLFGPR